MTLVLVSGWYSPSFLIFSIAVSATAVLIQWVASGQKLHFSDQMYPMSPKKSGSGEEDMEVDRGCDPDILGGGEDQTFES